MKNRAKQRWIAAALALLMVVGMMPADWTVTKVNAATSFEGGVPAADGNWAGWTWSVFGNGATSEKNAIKETADGEVQLSSTGNGGKIAGSQEGINFLYYTMDMDCDFILSAQAEVNTWASANQIGYGAMVRAAVGTHDVTADASPLNSAFVGGTVQSGKAAAGSYRTSKRGNIGDGIASSAGSTYDLMIQKTGDKLYLWREGELIKEGAASEILVGDKIYAGVFCSCEIKK